MRGRLAAALLILGLALLVPRADAEICTIGGPQGSVQYPCDAATGQGSGRSSGPWWADPTTQALVAFVGLAGSAAAGGWALWRVRSRRRALTEAMQAIEQTYAQTKAAPEAGIPRLVAMRAEFRGRHRKGKLDDGSFLDLDKRVTDAIVRLRFLELDRRFLGLPPALLTEVRRLVGDGLVSAEDADLVARHAAAFQVPEPRRSELVDLVRSWSGEDGPAEPAAPLPAHELLVR